jgi:diketogulonate reductase-like aldo/keto reductase
MELPLVGLGTWELRGNECAEVVETAIQLGYRHIDTAHVYQNHRQIKRAIEGFDRKQLYITSKIALEEQVDPKNPEKSVPKACESALEELGTDYLDLYLIHCPHPIFPLEKIFPLFEKLVDQGKILKAGVSNCNIHYLEDLRKAGLKPFANQVEFHPYLNQRELLDYCNSHQIKLISYRSFGKGKLLKEEPLFETIGEKYHKTGAQVILRWLIEKGIPVIPKASSKNHLKENLDIFDFSLTQVEMKKIENLHVNKRFCRPEDPVHKY